MQEAPEDPSLKRLKAAQDGDIEALSWLIEAFSPPLLALVRRRLSGLAGLGKDPEDCVQDVWSVFLQRIKDLQVTEPRCAPLIMRFLSRTFDLQFLNLVRQRNRRSDPTSLDSDRVPDLPAQTSGIVTKVVRSEHAALLLNTMETMDEREREVLHLRAIEQLSPADAGHLLGIHPNTVSQRFRRAIARIRDRLPGSIFDLLGSDAPIE